MSFFAAARVALQRTWRRPGGGVHAQAGEETKARSGAGDSFARSVVECRPAAHGEWR